MVANGSLDDVKQLVFEAHTHEMYNEISTVRDFELMYNLLLDLEELGFKKFRHHENPWGKYTSVRTGKQRSCCHELSYANINFLRNSYL